MKKKKWRPKHWEARRCRQRHEPNVIVKILIYPIPGRNPGDTLFLHQNDVIAKGSHVEAWK
jgi:hypothetical protein